MNALKIDQEDRSEASRRVINIPRYSRASCCRALKRDRHGFRNWTRMLSYGRILNDYRNRLFEGRFHLAGR
jgi:hypothetical protein